MKNSISIGFCWAFPNCAPEDGLPRLRACGFEGIELWPNFMREWSAERWAQSLKANEMRCFQLCPYFNFVHGEAKIEESRLLLEEYLAAAQVLDCRRLRVFTGPPWGEGVIGAREATPQQWQSSINALREFCERAAQDSVELCLECHEGSLMEDTPSTLRLLETVGASNLTVNLQLPLRDETWQTSVRALAPFTSHIHIHNWENGLGEGAMTFLADGVFDWKPVVRSLLDAGRALCLSVEHPNHNGRNDPWETARRDGPFLQRFRDEI